MANQRRCRLESKFNLSNEFDIASSGTNSGINSGYVLSVQKHCVLRCQTHLERRLRDAKSSSSWFDEQPGLGSNRSGDTDDFRGIAVSDCQETCCGKASFERVLWNQISQPSPGRRTWESELCSGYEIEILCARTPIVRTRLNERRSIGLRLELLKTADGGNFSWHW